MRRFLALPLAFALAACAPGVPVTPAPQATDAAPPTDVLAQPWPIDPGARDLEHPELLAAAALDADWDVEAYMVLAPVAPTAMRLEASIQDPNASGPAGDAALVKAASDVAADLAARHQRVQARLSRRLGDAERAAALAGFRATAVASPDGTHTQPLDFTVARDGALTSRHLAGSRREVMANGGLVSLTVDLDDVLANGATQHVHRDLEVQADGSYAVTEHAELTEASAVKRVVDLTRYVAPSGAMSGNGTCQVGDATARWIYQGSDEAPAVTRQ